MRATGTSTPRASASLTSAPVMASSSVRLPRSKSRAIDALPSYDQVRITSRARSLAWGRS